MLELARYIVLNPVRAGMVRSARDWPWSSYRAAGLIEASKWINHDWLLSNFSKRRQLALHAYRKFVSEGPNQPKPWETLRNQIYLGDDVFVEQSKQKIPTSSSQSEIPDFQSRSH